MVRTSFVARTIGIHGTFWMASRRTANVSRQTRANRLAVNLSALGKTTARRRPTAVIFFDGRLLNDRPALDECVAFHSRGTRAHRNVIVNITNGVRRTSAVARIGALASQTGLVSRTIAVQDAFWSALSVRIALQARQTRASSIVALRVIRARRRIAFILRNIFLNYCK